MLPEKSQSTSVFPAPGREKKQREKHIFFLREKYFNRNKFNQQKNIV